jgi:hypothetical protein
MDQSEKEDCLKHFTTILGLLLPLLIQAQTRKESWFRLNLTHRFNTNWSAGLDIQHRRQANYKTGDGNILHYPLSSFARAWIYYQLAKGWTLLLSPVGYFDNEDILNVNGELKQTNELRITPGVSNSLVTGPLKIRSRLLYDIRFADFDKPGHYMQSRLHWQESLLIPLCYTGKNSRLLWQVYDELFIKRQRTITGFEQNRIYNGLQWKVSTSTVDLGYQWVVQRGSSSNFKRSQVYLAFNIQL